MSLEVEFSEGVNELFEAMSKAQASFPVIPKSKTGKISGQGKNGYYEYSYKYADIADILKEVLPILSKNDLCVMQPTEFHDGVLFITTIIGHKSGQYMKGRYPACSVGKQKDMGAAITYAKRYSFSAMTGVSSDEDVDAPEVHQEAQAAPRPKANGNKRPPSPPKREEPSAQEFVHEHTGEVIDDQPRKVANLIVDIDSMPADATPSDYLFLAYELDASDGQMDGVIGAFVGRMQNDEDVLVRIFREAISKCDNAAELNFIRIATGKIVERIRAGGDNKEILKTEILGRASELGLGAGKKK